MIIEIDVPDKGETNAFKYQEIITALIGSGAFDLQNGKAVLHFDQSGTFQGVQLDYWAFRRKKK
ncbi:MAG: hypothetical protein HN802_02975 [Candidatus Jacksonbacteria bacterium]|jgi:hypothetical protein|nr:hypothetical protein [Candidatus Jacksonbacteria bacterium]